MAFVVVRGTACLNKHGKIEYNTNSPPRNAPASHRAVQLPMNRFDLVAVKLLSTLLFGMQVCNVLGEESLERGREIYARNCAVCHGPHGEGVPDSYDEPLVGDDSIGELAASISKTMPEGEPEKCVGEDAEAVAAYIHHSFYSEAAQIRNRPPSMSFAHLTSAQLRQSMADLYEQFGGRPPFSNRSTSNTESKNADTIVGIRGVYYDDRARSENKKIDRIDPGIDFDFGRESPGDGIKAEAFSIVWEGGVRADVSGRYEIVVRSTCSFVMDFGRIGRQLIDNHTQSGDRIEFRETVFLTAGRVYPFKIDFVQRKRKTEQPPARIRLAWVPPGDVERVIPTRNLVPNASSTFSLQTELPPDDRSYGFERGIAVNREWDASTTTAALEFAQIAIDELWPSYLNEHRRESGDDRSKMKQFLKQIVRTAFRTQQSDTAIEEFITQQLASEVDDAEAIKKCLLLTLKSPRFLYPLADANQSQSQRVANRVALVLFDSLPTGRDLQAAIANDEFNTADKVREYVREHFEDNRLRAKTRDMLHEWLNASQLAETTKDAELYPGFDAALVSDLRMSLNAFLDEIVWSEHSDFRQFFSSDWAFTTPRISEFYAQAWANDLVLNSDTVAPNSPTTDSSTENSTVAGKVLATDLVKTSANADGTERTLYGLLTHPYLMSGLAYHDASSPIRRGVFLIRFMLGRTLRPPADAFSPLSPDLHPALTTRERVSLQTSPESCQVCHRKINALGFALENYDAVGRFRKTEQNKPIDASGRYTARDDREIEFEDVGALAAYLTQSEDAHRAFVNRAFQHFVKQPAAAFGADVLDKLVAHFEENDCNIRELIVEIAVVSATQPLGNGSEKTGETR